MPKDAHAAEKKSRSRRKRRNSFKGALIKGMTQRLPVELIGDLSFQEGLQQIMRGYAGVYALYSGERLYYVGLQTTCTIAFAGTRRTNTVGGGIDSLSSACDVCGC
jgi:hypothetical protein